MSVTGKLQAIGSRGYSLLWSTAPADRPDYETLSLDILDRTGAIVATDCRPAKILGSVVAKEGVEAQRTAQIAWAEEVTRNPLTPPDAEPAEPPAVAVIEEPVSVQEEIPHGEEISPPVSGVVDLEAQANDPV